MNTVPLSTGENHRPNDGLIKRSFAWTCDRWVTVQTTCNNIKILAFEHKQCSTQLYSSHQRVCAGTHTHMHTQIITKRG